MYSPGNERGPTLENDYLESDDRAPSDTEALASVIPVAMAHDNQQDVRIDKHFQAWSICMLYVVVCALLTLLQDYYYYKLYEWGVFVPTAVSFSSYKN